jgi:hypothetical protein
MPRQSWLDPKTQAPQIDTYAQQMSTFLEAMADGKIDANELASQEQRLTAVMQEVEPLLNDELHAKVTKLLCEMAAFDLMQIMHSLHAARPTTTFRG